MGTEDDAAGIGIPASSNSVRYRGLPVPDLGTLIPVTYWMRHRHFFHSGTGLTGCRTVRRSGIQKSFSRASQILPWFSNVEQLFVLM